VVAVAVEMVIAQQAVQVLLVKGLQAELVVQYRVSSFMVLAVAVVVRVLWAQMAQQHQVLAVLVVQVSHHRSQAVQ
jgi:hypothetical protein